MRGCSEELEAALILLECCCWLLTVGLQLHEQILVGLGEAVFGHADNLVAHAQTAVFRREATPFQVNLGPHHELHWRLMQSIHCQVLDCTDVLMHLEELFSIDSKHGLADLSEAPEHKLTAAIAHLDREVVGGLAIVKRAHARLTIVADARIVLNHLLLAYFTCQVKHLPIGRLGHENPG